MHAYCVLGIMSFFTFCILGALSQGRINQYANYAMAWGPSAQGAPAATQFFSYLNPNKH